MEVKIFPKKLPSGFMYDTFMSLEGDFSARSATRAAPPIQGRGLSVLVEVFIYSSTNSIISNIPYASNTHVRLASSLVLYPPTLPHLSTSLPIYLCSTHFDQSGRRGSNGDPLSSHPHLELRTNLFLFV